MTPGDEKFSAMIRDAYRQSGASLLAPPPSPGCPSLPRLAQALYQGWQDQELAHVAHCARCQKIVAAEFRIECPGFAVLAHYAAGDSPFAAALDQHLAEDCESRCRRRLQSPWLQGVAAALRAGAMTETILQDSLRHLANSGVRLASVPAFLPLGGETAIQVHAVCEDGLIAVTLKQEGSQVVAYVESPNTSVAGHTVAVELLGDAGSQRAQVILRMVDGIGAFGFHNFGSLADLAVSLGGECEILAVLER